jgi:uncharacterized lipoprotein YddW (UPF0748 family)
MPGNWAWLSGSDDTPDDHWKALFDKMLSGNINGLLLEGSNTLYARLGPLSQKAGIQLHAWRWTINRGQYMEEHPEWYTVSREGLSVIEKPPYVGYYRWLCPSRPEVKEVLINDYSTLAGIPGIAGVHLDYVRYCDIYLPVGLLPKYNLVQDHEMAEFDYCYCPLCRETFHKKSGYDPMDLKDPAGDADWRQFRLDQLVSLVQDLAAAIKARDSVITGAVFPTPEMSRVMVRQDWARFNLDAYQPMLYHQFYLKGTEWIGECIREARKEVDKKIPIYAGIMIHPSSFSPEVLERTIQEVRDAGGQGLSAFTAHGLSDQHLKILAGIR